MQYASLSKPLLLSYLMYRLQNAHSVVWLPIIKVYILLELHGLLLDILRRKFCSIPLSDIAV